MQKDQDKQRFKARLTILICAIAIVAGLALTQTTTAVPVEENPVDSALVPPPKNLSRDALRYRITSDGSRFMAHVGSTGLLWFLGHPHHFAIKDFAGEAIVAPGKLESASLEMTVNSGSLEETGENFTNEQKQIITNTARKEVLEADEYPEISFRSTGITGISDGGEHQHTIIHGNLTLHGVTRPVDIKATVIADANLLHATGHFSIKRSDYGVKTKSIKHGLIRVSNRVRFEFDIAARRA